MKTHIFSLFQQYIHFQIELKRWLPTKGSVLAQRCIKNSKLNNVVVYTEDRFMH